jgi:hypothetical protein
MESLTLDYINDELEHMQEFNKRTHPNMTSAHSSELDDTVTTINNTILSDPLSENTSRHIKGIWSKLGVAREQGHWHSIKIKCQRHQLLLANMVVWNWIEYTVYRRCQEVLRREQEGFCWFDGLVNHVDNLIMSSSPSCDIYPQQFTSMAVEPFLYVPPKSRHRAFTTEERETETLSTTINIISQWLGFETDGMSRRHAWLTRKLIEGCGENVLLLDKVWAAHHHMKTEIFHNNKILRITEAKLAPIDSAIRDHNMSHNDTLESYALAKIGELVQRFMDTSAIPSAETSHTLSRDPDLVHVSGGKALMGMHRFAAYLRRMRPLLDPQFSILNMTDPLLIAAYNNKDELSPFRERAPSRVRVQGPHGPYREDYLWSRTGIFNAVTFRGITYRANVLFDPTFPIFYPNLNAFQEAVAGRNIDDIRCMFAYHTPNSFRVPELAETYWRYSAEWPGLLAGGPLDFDACVEFLMHDKPNYFPQLGPLCAFLTAGDLAYTSAVNMPSADTVGKYIGLIRKGSAVAMKELDIISHNEHQVAVFCSGAQRLHNFLLNDLTREERIEMGYEQLTMEHALCKYHIASDRGLI